MDILACDAEKCQRSAHYFCNCKKSYVLLCHDHALPHLHAGGEHSTQAVFKSLTAVDQDKVLRALDCIEAATRRALFEERQTLNHQVCNLLDRVRKLHERHTKVVHTILASAKQVTESLVSLQRYGLNKVQYPDAAGVSEVLHNELGKKVAVAKLRQTIVQVQNQWYAKKCIAAQRWKDAEKAQGTEAQVQAYREAAQLYCQLRLRHPLPPVLLALAKCLAKNGAPDQALNNLREAEVISRELSLHQTLAEVLFQIGHLSLRTCLVTQEHLPLFEECARLGTDLKIPSIVGPAHNNWGLALHSLGKHEEATAVFRDAVQIYRRNKQMNKAIVTLNNLAEVYLAGQKFAEAISVGMECRALAQHWDQKSELKRALENIIEALTGAGHDQEVRQFLVELDQLDQ